MVCRRGVGVEGEEGGYLRFSLTCLLWLTLTCQPMHMAILSVHTPTTNASLSLSLTCSIGMTGDGLHGQTLHTYWISFNFVSYKLPYPHTLVYTLFLSLSNKKLQSNSTPYYTSSIGIPQPTYSFPTLNKYPRT